MAIPVTSTSRFLNKLMPKRTQRLGRKLSRVVDLGGSGMGPRRLRKLDTEEKIWAKMEKYLAKGAELNELYDDSTALGAACQRNLEGIARKLVDLGADVNITGFNYGNMSPLMCAAGNANIGLTRLLLEKGGDPNVSTGRSSNTVDMVIWACTPPTANATHIAKPAEAKECLKLLLQYGLNPQQQQKINVFQKAPALAELLPDVQGALDVKAAVEDNDLPALRDLLVTGVSPDILHAYETETPLCHAAATGNVDMIELLLSAGAKIELKSPVSKYTPLQAATFHGQKEAFVMLMQRGADDTATCDVKYTTPTTLDDVARHSTNPRMIDFIQNVRDSLASAPPPVNTDLPIKVNKPLRIKAATP